MRHVVPTNEFLFRTADPCERKQCTACKQTLPLESFYFSRGKHACECKSCIRQRQRNYNSRPEVRSKRLAEFGYVCSTDKRKEFDLINFHSSYVVSKSGCWEWVACLTHDGYGRLSSKELKRRIRSHRFSFYLHFGRLLKADEFVCHKCDNPLCVNPAHLYLGDAKDNCHDSMYRGTKAYKGAVGERNCKAKLDEDKVRNIRQQMAAGAKAKELSKVYGVSTTVINNIKNRVLLKHVEDKPVVEVVAQ